MEMERDELGYAGGKGTWFVVVIILLIALISISYAVAHFFPDLSNWLKKGVDPDKIIWQVERGK